MISNQSKPAKLRCFISILLIVFIIAVNSSCKTKTDAQNETGNESLPEEKNIVETVILEKQDFTREIISNGKLAAIQKAELYFKNPGIIETIKVGNGEIDPTSTEMI
jgi:membrane fusion protein, multidrug efflux system